MKVRALLAVESIKTFNRLGFWVLLGFFLLLLFLVGASSLYNQFTSGYADPFRLPDAWPAIVNAATLLSLFSVLSTTVLLTASEWGWRTARQNVIDGMTRNQFFASKATLVPLVAASYWAAALALGGGLALVGTVQSPGSGTLLGAVHAQMLGGLLLYLLMAGAMGLFFGMAATGAGPALALCFLSFAGLAVAGGVLRQAGMAGVADALPHAVLLSVANPVTYDASALRVLTYADPDAARALEVSAAPVVAMACAYTAAFTAAAWAVFRRRTL